MGTSSSETAVDKRQTLTRIQTTLKDKLMGHVSFLYLYFQHFVVLMGISPMGKMIKCMLGLFMFS